VITAHKQAINYEGWFRRRWFFAGFWSHPYCFHRKPDVFLSISAHRLVKAYFPVFFGLVNKSLAVRRALKKGKGPRHYLLEKETVERPLTARLRRKESHL
jgi:hypothetical protein